MNRHLTPAILAAPCVVALLAACGGGGGGGSAGSTEVNEGSYSIDAFDYVDSKPEWYHPLGDPTYAFVRRDEVALFFPAPGPSVAVEDELEEGATNTPIPAAATADLNPIQATSGDLDGNGRPEAVLIGTFGPAGAKQLRVRALGMDESGWQVLGSFDIGLPGENYSVGRVELGDVDGDSRDEIIVAATRAGAWSWVRVYDDPVDGGGYGMLLHAIDFPGTAEVRAVAAKLDDDPARELVIQETAPPVGFTHFHDDAASGYAPMPFATNTWTNLQTADLVVANRDDDARDEICVLRVSGQGDLAVTHVFAPGELGESETIDVVEDIGPWSATDPKLMRRTAAGDLDGDGLDEVVFLHHDKPLGGSVDLATAIWVHVVWSSFEAPYVLRDPTDELVFGDVSPSSINLEGLDVAVVDRGGDPDKPDRELVVAFVVQIGSPAGSGGLIWYEYKHEGFGPAELPLTQTDDGSVELAVAEQVVLTGDDFDLDGVRVRYLGHKHLNLPNPVPMVVLSAPPTKAGISQNYDASEVSYATEVEQEASYECEWAASVSLSAGLESDLFGFGLGWKATFQGTAKTTLEQTDVVATSQSFTGAHEDDVVIFNGALHMVYEYEVVASADPDLIGTKFTVNQPLQAKTYKWTREFFEQEFGPDSTLPPGHLTHTIGDPASYPSKLEAEILIGDYVGALGGFNSVGQGSGSSGVELSIASSLGGGTGWGYGAEQETTVKVAGVEFALTISAEEEWIYSNKTTNGTTYAGEVGDIQDGEDYLFWNYDFGVFTYRYEEDGKVPVQFVRFWTDPTGQGY